MSTGKPTCACGCGATVNTGRRYVFGHARRRDPVAAFWERVDKAPGCWNWEGATNGRYGHLSVRSKPVSAHRFAYELLVGPIPPGLTIDHLCRNKLCVNPEHLEAVTAIENYRRAYVAPSHCPQGHPYTEENMVTRHGSARRECRQCNREAALRRYHARKDRS